MNKSLEHLEILESLVTIYGKFEFDFTEIEKELEALEIIKEKGLDVGLFIHRVQYQKMNYKEYLEKYPTVFYRQYLTQEEYDLLKEELL